MKVRINYDKYADRMSRSSRVYNDIIAMINYIKDREDNKGLIETDEYMENRQGSKIYNIVGFAVFEDELEIIEE